MSPHSEHELLSAYADGALTDAERVAVERHLAACAEARSVLGAIRATLSDLAGLDDPEIDAQVSWAIRSAVARERRLTGRARRWSWAAGAAAASVVAVLAFTLAARDGGPGARSAAGTATLAEAPRPGADYDEASAQGLLQNLFAGRFALALDASSEGVAARAVEPAGAAAGEDQASPEALSAPPAPEPDTFTVQAAKRTASQKRFRECVAAVEKTSKQPPGLLLAFEATYKRETAYFLFFEVPAAEPNRLELWVLAADSCEVRYFAQAKLSR